MPAEIRTQYLDSSVLLAYIRDEPQRAPVVEQLLREANASKRVLLSSTVAVVEVVFGAEATKGGALDPGTLRLIDDLWSAGRPVTLVEASLRLMEEARDVARKARAANRALRPLDAIHLATAARQGAETVFTYEKPETREVWAELLGIPVEEPSVEQMPML